MSQGPLVPSQEELPAERIAPRRQGFVKRPRRGPGSYDRRLSPEQRREEQRRTLVEAAAYVFAHEGYASASVASILDASGLSRGTFYRHFQDLREVFLAAQKNASDVLFARLEAAFRAQAAPADKLRACVQAYLQFCLEHGDLSRVFHREARVSGPEYAELRRRSLDRVAGLLRAGLAEGVATGQLARLPSDLTVHAVMVAIEGIALRYLEEHREAELLEALGPLVRLAGRAFT
jgi:AcrR family transcriptional regulator